MTRQYDSFYLSHGGGPMPLLGDPGHQQILRFYGEVPGTAYLRSQPHGHQFNRFQPVGGGPAKDIGEGRGLQLLESLAKKQHHSFHLSISDSIH